MFRDSRRLDCFLDRFLNHRLIDVVAALHAGVPVKVLATCGKHELPSPVTIQVTHTSAKETIPLQMHPRVFAALGADLITNDIVAIVELVKNSFCRRAYKD